jgi:hypothetical protein
MRTKSNRSLPTLPAIGSPRHRARRSADGSSLWVLIQRSALAFPWGARAGVRRMRMASLANTASKVAVNLVSRSRIKNVKLAARSPSPSGGSAPAGRPCGVPEVGPLC